MSHTNTEERKMKAYILGVITGIILTTVGFSGIARMADNGISKVQEVSREAAK
jgi:heme/copper-type cytochrome/quinol oxidase subunit 4